MKTGAQPLFPSAEGRASVPALPLRALPLVDADEAARAELVRRLAADRLRDLRDDGVTTAYMARMYGVEPERMREMLAALGLGAR